MTIDTDKESGRPLLKELWNYSNCGDTEIYDLTVQPPLYVCKHDSDDLYDNLNASLSHLAIYELHPIPKFVVDIKQGSELLMTIIMTAQRWTWSQKTFNLLLAYDEQVRLDAAIAAKGSSNI